MYPLIESIKVQNNKIFALSYHERRMNKSLHQLFGTTQHKVNFEKLQKEALGLDKSLTYKLKISYSNEGYEYHFKEYDLKPINSLQLVYVDSLDYNFKFSDRNILDHLYASRDEADDIIIVRNDLVTDSFYCNLAFSQNGQWFTPDMPLLEGTQRQYLLDNNIITQKEIFYEDLPDYNEVCLFNAMVPFEKIILDVSAIKF